MQGPLHHLQGPGEAVPRGAPSSQPSPPAPEFCPQTPPLVPQSVCPPVTPWICGCGSKLGALPAGQTQENQNQEGSQSKLLQQAQAAGLAVSGPRYLESGLEGQVRFPVSTA